MDLSTSYRTSSDYKEILRILQKASSLKDNFIWQKHGDGRIIHRLRLLEIDFVSREFVCTPEDLDHLKMDHPLYVKLEWRGCVFKVVNFIIENNQIHFPFPEEIKALELRSVERIKFHSEQNKAASLKVLNLNKIIFSTDLEVRVLDISQKGMGLLVSDTNLPIMMKNKSLLCTSLGDLKLPVGVKAEVLYSNSDLEVSKLPVGVQKRWRKFKKVGVKFLEPLPQSYFEKFCR